MLDPKAFVKGCTLVANHIRTRADCKWDEEDWKLKYASFGDDFPEVSSIQFLWACERWIQIQGAGNFLRFPTWNELMAPLYRCENGLANRSWGPKEDLPKSVRFSTDQCLLMPTRPHSIAPAPDPQNAQAYEVVGLGAKYLPQLTPTTTEN